MLFVDTSIIHYSSEGVLILCNILDLLIYSFSPIFISDTKIRRVFYNIATSLKLTSDY